MRNADRIKQLEAECWKYRKKIAAQQKQLAALKDIQDQMDALHMVVDTVMAQVVMEKGEARKEGGEVIGWTLVVEKPNAAVLEKYAVHANHFGGKLNIGVVPRGD